MSSILFEIFRNFLNPPDRGEIQVVSYAEADKLLRTKEWKLAIPEEDKNHLFNKVYIEKIIKEN